MAYQACVAPSGLVHTAVNRSHRRATVIEPNAQFLEFFRDDKSPAEHTPAGLLRYIVTLLIVLIYEHYRTGHRRPY